MREKILIIDDDQKLNNLLIEYLNDFNYQVLTATHPDDGMRILRTEHPKLLILDVMLPDKDGFELCRQIRQHYTLPIIMLTARGELTDKVIGLELGADDYLAKPFEPRELVARIQSVLRRGNHRDTSRKLTIGGLFLDIDSYSAILDGTDLNLTTMEFELLRIFVKNPNIVLSRDQLLEHLSGIDWDPDNRSVDVLLSRLRQKLGDNPKSPAYIKTVRGVGYLFIGDSNAHQS
ncbi:MAG: response regulator transcription factor [Spirochaetota bacterium]|nr:response regulator transcription factor [Spirochaetota bacterium]